MDICVCTYRCLPEEVRLEIGKDLGSFFFNIFFYCRPACNHLMFIDDFILVKRKSIQGSFFLNMRDRIEPHN